MTSYALTIPTIELQPNPLPFGELRLQKGVWDQLQARKAYDETAHEPSARSARPSACDFKI